MAFVTLGDFALIGDNVLARIQTATGGQRAAVVAAIRGPRRSFDRNRPRGTLNNDMKNIPLTGAPQPLSTATAPAV